jgi:hypothetical protein
VFFSETGVSTPFKGTEKGQAVDADVYITKCLPKMLKFIEKDRKNDEAIFWPDLTSYQYAKKMLEWLEQSNIYICQMLITSQMCHNLDKLKIYGLCWLVQFISKDKKQKTRLNFAVKSKES